MLREHVRRTKAPRTISHLPLVSPQPERQERRVQPAKEPLDGIAAGAVATCRALRVGTRTQTSQNETDTGLVSERWTERCRGVVTSPDDTCCTGIPAAHRHTAAVKKGTSKKKEGVLPDSKRESGAPARIGTGGCQALDWLKTR